MVSQKIGGLSWKKRVAWNKGRIIGQKAPLKQQEIWAIRTRLEIAKNTRELALLNLAIDSKLRGCDLVSLKVSDVMRSGEVLARTSIVQHKTGTPVQFGDYKIFCVSVCLS